MIKFFTNFFNSKQLFTTLIIVIILKILSIYEINKNRELPIEPDDTFIYFSHSFSLYKDDLREKKTMQSAKDLVFSSYEKERELKTSKDVSDISYLERFFIQTYYIYSKIFGFFYEYFDLDRQKLWWLSNYISQILILVSSYCIFLMYANNLKNTEKIILILSSFFFVLSVKHHINATPMTIGASIMIIGNYFVYKKNYIFGFLILFLSLHFHPGIFLILSLFLGLYFILFIIEKRREDLIVFIALLFPAIIAITIEQFLYLNETARYLGIFEQKYEDQNFSKMESIFDIFVFNYEATKSNFLKMLYPFIPFFLHNKKIALLIYLISVIFSYKYNMKIFILNILIIILVIIGNFYFFAITHPGNMIYYQSQGMIAIISITIFSMYFLIFKKIQKLFKIKYSSMILILFLSIIFFHNSYKYTKIIQLRTDRMNYQNLVPEIKKFKNAVIKHENDALIIGDELALYMFISLFENTHFYLDNSLRKNNKIWHYKNRSYKPKGYIGALNNKQKLIEKTIKYGDQSFTFNNIKKFKDFYFLYD